MTMSKPLPKSVIFKWRTVGFALLVTAATFLSLASPAKAILHIDITQGTIEPLPIALPNFIGVTQRELTLGRNIVGIVAADLQRSGLFAPIDQGAFIEKITSMDAKPRFGDWRIINAQALVTGRGQLMDDGRLKIEFRLWDAFAEEQVTGIQFFAAPDNWRRIGHLIADTIYERLTGESGYFDTRVVYIAESGAKDRRVKQLAIMDQDGANHRYLTDGKYLALTPRFSPSSQQITYMSYYRNQPRVYLLDIETGQQEVVGDFPGMTFAPRFSPDGKKIVLSLERNGNSDIYSMVLTNRRINRLTNSAAINTAPSYAPDASRIVFESDRGGTQQIYVMDANGGNARRISFGDGRYGTPVWSPRGDLIAFTKMYQGRFLIGVMRPDGQGERILTEGYHNEGPTWSPNGRVLMFFREGRGPGSGPHLYSIDLTGYNERIVTTPQEASDPAWSPLLK